MLTDFPVSQKQSQLSQNSLITVKTKHPTSIGHIRCKAILFQLLLITCGFSPIKRVLLLQKWATLRGLCQRGQLPIVCWGNSQNQKERRNLSRNEEGNRRRCGCHCLPECCRQNQKPRLRLRGIPESPGCCHGPEETPPRLATPRLTPESPHSILPASAAVLPSKGSKCLLSLCRLCYVLNSLTFLSISK